MTSKYDHIVVGAGIEGSWTAYHLIKSGCKVLLLEQFNLPHTRGSSHGQSRITRYGYAEDFHTALMSEAYSKWEQLEREAAVRLFIQTGALYVADKTAYHDLDCLVSNISRQPNAVFKTLNSGELRHRFPQVQFDRNYNACMEMSAGVLLADRCLATVQKRFKDLGGELIDGFEVQKIEPGPPALVKGVRTMKMTNNYPSEQEETFVGDSVIICAGPWSGPLLSKTLGLNLPLSPRRLKVCYWHIKDKSKGGLPVVFIDLSNNGEYYGLPSIEYPNMIKLCCHYQEEVDPNSRDVSNKKEDNNEIIKYVKNHFLTLEPNPAIIETCMYTMTPDNVCILDKHPLYENIIIGCGFSGTGFKISPVVAHILGNMAQKKSPVHNIKPFAMSRFKGILKRSKL